MSYIAHISCFRIHICKRFFFSVIIPEMENKKEINLRFWITFVYIISVYLILNKLIQSEILKLMQSETLLLLKSFYSRELDYISFQTNIPLI